MKKTNKTEQVMNHLIQKGAITSWEAIKLYKATRLSAIIFCLRKNRSMNITTDSIFSKDINGNNCTYAKYIYLAPMKSKTAK